MSEISTIGIQSFAREAAWNLQRVRLYESQIRFKSPRKLVNRVIAVVVLSGDEGYREGYIYMIQWLSDSLAHSAHSSTLFSTSSLGAAGTTSSARQRAEEAGWRTTRKATILSRETLTRLTSVHLQKRIPERTRATC